MCCNPKHNNEQQKHTLQHAICLYALQKVIMSLHPNDVFTILLDTYSVWYVYVHECIWHDKSPNKESIYTILISTLFHPGIIVDILL